MYLRRVNIGLKLRRETAELPRGNSSTLSGPKAAINEEGTGR